MRAWCNINHIAYNIIRSYSLLLLSGNFCFIRSFLFLPYLAGGRTHNKFSCSTHSFHFFHFLRLSRPLLRFLCFTPASMHAASVNTKFPSKTPKLSEMRLCFLSFSCLLRHWREIFFTSQRSPAERKKRMMCSHSKNKIEGFMLLLATLSNRSMDVQRNATKSENGNKIITKFYTIIKKKKQFRCCLVAWGKRRVHASHLWSFAPQSQHNKLHLCRLNSAVSYFPSSRGHTHPLCAVVSESVAACRCLCIVERCYAPLPLPCSSFTINFSRSNKKFNFNYACTDHTHYTGTDQQARWYQRRGQWNVLKLTANS